MTNELTPLDDDEQAALDPEPGTEPEPDAQEQPSELETLRAEVEALKQNHAVIEDLRRSVGRMQSLATKWESATATERDQISKQMEERFSTVDEQIAQILSGLDDTSIDPETKRKILSVQESARRAAELRTAVADELSKRAPQASPPTDDISPLERELVNMITAAKVDLDSPVFDWKGEMSSLAKADPTGASLRAHVIEKIIEAKSEDSAATRRATAKRQAGNGAPKPNSVTPNEAERISQSLDAGDLATALRERAALMR